MGEFYVFQLKLLHFPNELLAENWRYIHGDINDEPWLFQIINVTYFTYFNYSFVQVKPTSTGQSQEDHWYTKQQAL